MAQFKSAAMPYFFGAVDPRKLKFMMQISNQNFSYFCNSERLGVVQKCCSRILQTCCWNNFLPLENSANAVNLWAGWQTESLFSLVVNACLKMFISSKNLCSQITRLLGSFNDLDILNSGPPLHYVAYLGRLSAYISNKTKVPLVHDL